MLRPLTWWGLGNVRHVEAAGTTGLAKMRSVWASLPSVKTCEPTSTNLLLR